jgi:hypothetical protein
MSKGDKPIRKKWSPRDQVAIDKIDLKPAVSKQMKIAKERTT